MVEVPALLYQLDELLKRVDFLSVGSNDLMQFMFAADRSNTRIASRFDPISPPLLRALKEIVDRRERGQEAGDAVRRTCLAADRRAGAHGDRLPLDVALGFGGRTREGDAARSRYQEGRATMQPLLDGAGSKDSVRQKLEAFAAAEGLQL